MNRISAETAATISGVTSGISISTLALPAQRVRARTSPNASIVPSTVATIIVTNAIWMLAMERLAERLVLEEALVPLEAEALEVLERADRVEREQRDERDRREHEHEEERREGGQEARAVEVLRRRPGSHAVRLPHAPPRRAAERR